jgi:hypothetical protein
MDGFVAACDPAGTVLETSAVVFTASQDLGITGGGRALKVALEAEICVAGDQHLGVYRAVRVMAGCAPFTHCIVNEYKGTFLRRMALGAGFVLGLESRAALALDGIAFMRVMTVTASDLARHYWMAVGKAELTALVQMALEAGLWILGRIDNRTLAAASLHVGASSSVASLAPLCRALYSIDCKLGMGRGGELCDDFSVAGRALLRSD